MLHLLTWVVSNSPVWMYVQVHAHPNHVLGAGDKVYCLEHVSFLGLDRYVKNTIDVRNMNPKKYTTREAADAAGITRVTLQTWIRKRNIAAPRLERIANIRVRLWSDSDVDRLKKVKKKIYYQRPMKAKAK
jgi:hypothetical protein